jgi:hypothetical protein
MPTSRRPLELDAVNRVELAVVLYAIDELWDSGLVQR